MKKYIILTIIGVTGWLQSNAQWSLSGNSGTSPCTDFIGTTDNKDLCIKTNNLTRIRIDNSGDVAIGAFTAAFKLDVNGDINFNSDAYKLYMDATPILKADNSDGSIFGGQDAGNSITLGSGVQCTAFGHHGLYANTTGYQNSAFGNLSLPANTTGSDNTGIGYAALNANTTGGGGTACGAFALSSCSTQTYNTAVGLYAGGYYGSTNCTFVGAWAYQASPGGYSNSSAFGYGATNNASNQIIIGNASVTQIGGIVAWTNPISDRRFKKNVKENVPGLNFITKLRPVTYTLDLQGYYKFIDGGVPHQGHEVSPESEQIVYSGFIAQEVESSANELNYDFSGVNKPQNDRCSYGLRYSEFVVPITKAIQDIDVLLKEKDAKLTAQQAQIDELKTMVATLIESDSRKATGIENGNTGLKQNQPNPFSEKTTINYTLPADAAQATITIYSVNGKEVGNYPVSASSGTVEISAKTLSPGNYIYKLIANDVIIDSKIMTITR